MTADELSLEGQAWVRGFLRAYAMFGRDVVDPIPYLPTLSMRVYGRTIWGEP